MSYFLTPWEYRFNDIVAYGNIDVEGQVNVVGNVYADYIYGNIIGNTISALPAVGSLDVRGNIIGTYANMSQIISTAGNIANVRFARDGNVTASYYFGNGSQLTGVTSAFPGTANLDILNGNITGSYANVSNIIATFGNIANVRFARDGNVTASYYFGNGSQLTGVTSAFPGTANLDILNGNITGSYANVSNIIATFGNIANVRFARDGNVTASYYFGNGSQLTGVTSTFPGTANLDILYGNFTGVTVTVSNIYASGYASLSGVSFESGNINMGSGTLFGGNIFGSVSNVSNINAKFGNIANVRFVGGNIEVSGQVNVLGNVVAPFFIGNGSQLTGIAAALPGVIAADINGNLTGSFSNVSNIIATFGNIANVRFGGGNVAVSGQVNVFGNIVANTFIGNQSILSLGSNAHAMNLISTNVNYTSTMLQLLSTPVTLTDLSNFTFIECDNFNGTTSNLAPFAVWGNGSVDTTGSFNVKDPTDTASFRFRVANSGILRSNVRTIGTDIANFQAINGAFDSTMLNLQAGRTASSAFNFIRCQNGNGATAPFVVDGAGNAIANYFLGNITGSVANIGNTRFLGGNVSVSGQVNVAGNIVVAGNGTLAGLYLSSAGAATSNNNILFSSTGNIDDNNVNAIGWNGTQVRFSTIGGSSGYIFTQYVNALTTQTEVGNLNYFSGSTFKCNGVNAFAAQVINISTSYTGSMILTESSTASAGTFHHIRCKSSAGNVFRVLGNGTVYSASGLYLTGADYAEFFEWADGNISKEDRRGAPVVLNGNKIRIVSQSDDPYDIIGVVSTNPTVLGDSAWNEWSGVHIKDKYGQCILETKYYYANVSNIEEELIPCSEGDIPPEGYVIKTRDEPIINPAYDPSKPYINRIDRKEWAPIGLCGKVRVDNSFVSANLVHPSWKTLRVIDDPNDRGNSAAQVAEMLIGISYAKPDTSLEQKINSLENTIEILKKALNL
ncbi:Chlorovirus glycoprotein repeat domain-containing protein [Acanthocystis turfacea Chlorella virus Br0604L]|nr:Chlorovirus glycoprotein repeat domain-containing protein [Acanthocystis turfacea Chlorella virus Br0604L]